MLAAQNNLLNLYEKNLWRLCAEWEPAFFESVRKYSDARVLEEYFATRTTLFETGRRLGVDLEKLHLPPLSITAQRTVDELERAYSEIETLRTRIAEMEASHSWKVGSALMAAPGYVKKIVKERKGTGL